MAHHKNRRPKPYKGCCWMCAKGVPRNHREPTLQEQRAERAPAALEAMSSEWFWPDEDYA